MCGNTIVTTDQHHYALVGHKGRIRDNVSKFNRYMYYMFPKVMLRLEAKVQQLHLEVLMVSKSIITVFKLHYITSYTFYITMLPGETPTQSN